MGLPGAFYLQYIPRALTVRGDASATAGLMLSSEPLFRVGLFAELVSSLVFILTPLVLYSSSLGSGGAAAGRASNVPRTKRLAMMERPMDLEESMRVYAGPLELLDGVAAPRPLRIFSCVALPYETWPVLTDTWEEQLEECYARVLRGLVAAGGSRELAEDALQDAIVVALRPGISVAVERVDAWLYVVGLRALRRHRWRHRLERSLGLATDTAAAPSEDRIAALQMLAALTARQREFVVARFWLDMTYREIADHFGVSVGTATSTVTQALERIRRVAGGREGKDGGAR
jgi:RNA polymerase sigma-70 factor (ECF subfamily)